MVTMKAGNWSNEYYGLSTDTKPPVNVPNGSTFYEMDTKSVFLFDAENGIWIVQ